ncbi:catechol 2,3-dioxygenase-like lactoylglutathione lyase family enzyme [Peribacillus simplex]|nr:catechol 2,3-dioxygenase-like lactoylglutathione lyase family enzyme [Peribacillus simplex]
MIRGLYEAHLPVRDLNRSIEFYEGLGLQLDHKVEETWLFYGLKRIKVGWGFGKRKKWRLSIILPSGI